MVKNKLLNKYLIQLKKHKNNADLFYLKFNNDSMEKEIYDSAIIDYCIRFEALIADYHYSIFKIQGRYNKPWKNTREIAKFLKVNIVDEYKKAHDAWNYYNALKHVNYYSKINILKICERYDVDTTKEISEFIYFCIIDLIKKLDK